MLLETIKGPEDLKRIPLGRLPEVAEEIRRVINTTVPCTGGHLASSLGAVELTLALHYVFDSPVDTIVWDVGHQAYAHKILTGRLGRFPTLRQYKGLSGFVNPDESPHDSFHVGHAGTAASLMDGVANARRLLGRPGRVVAVVGDASIANGMSFEALNHIGHHRTHCILVLNDNEMSISKNVGALARYLNRLITGPGYNRLKIRSGQWISSIPRVGPALKRCADRLQEFLKGAIVPGLLFEELGFRYVGPIDGHDLAVLVDTFRRTAFMTDRPLLVHVVTKKGKGHCQAEEDPETYHGVAKPGRGGVTYTQVFGETMVRLAQADPRIVAVTAAMKEGTGLGEFSRRFPDRFFDVGIAEEHAVTFAAAMAKEGLRPFVAIYSTFLQRAFDQIIHDVALPRLPVRLCLDRAGVVGDDGPTHNGQFDLSYLSLIPNLVVLAPKDEEELRMTLAWMASYDQGPVAVRYPKGVGEGVSPRPEDPSFDPRRWEVLREGPDALVLATGSCVMPALRACEELAAEGIRPTLVNCRCVKPIDEATLLPLLESCRAVLTVEENVLAGGFGSAVAAFASERGLLRPFRRLGLPDAFLETGPAPLLRDLFGLGPEGIAEGLRGLIASPPAGRRER